MSASTPSIPVPAPVYYLGALGTGFLIDLAVPGRIFPIALGGHLLGWPLLGIAIGVGFWATRTLTREGESPDPGQPTGKIITTGPYAYTRNPIYLAFTLIVVGFGFVLNSFWPLILLLPALFLVQRKVISIEEHHLEDQFGEEYGRYRSGVRRWL